MAVHVEEAAGRVVARIDAHDEADLEGSVRVAFAQMRNRLAESVVLAFAPSMRLPSLLVEVVSDELERSRTIQDLTLVHPASSTGFFASAIGLRVQTVRVSGVSSYEGVAAFESRSSAPPPRTSYLPSAVSISQYPRAATASVFPPELRGQLVIVALRRDEPVETGVARAFLDFRDRGARAAAVLFDDASSPTTALTDLIVSELDGAPAVRALALVHASAALGFLASSVGLRAPHVRVRAFADVAAAEKAFEPGPSR